MYDISDMTEPKDDKTKQLIMHFEMSKLSNEMYKHPSTVCVRNN